MVWGGWGGWEEEGAVQYLDVDDVGLLVLRRWVSYW